MSSPNDEKKQPQICSISKKRYDQLKSFITHNYGERAAHEICAKLCEITKFDPTYVNSSEEKVAKVKEWRRKKAAELGISISKVAKGLKNIKLPVKPSST